MLLFRVAVVLVFLFMVGRLYQLQIVQGESYRERADDNRFDLIEVHRAARRHLRSHGQYPDAQPAEL